jgi:hypothetical protein
MSDEFAPRRHLQAGACDVLSSVVQSLWHAYLVRIPIVWEMLKRLAPKGDLFFLHYPDVLPPDGGDRFTQSECSLGQL